DVPADDGAHRHVGPGHDLTEHERLEEALLGDQSVIHQRPLELREHREDAAEQDQPDAEEDPEEREQLHSANSRISPTGIATARMAKSEAPRSTAAPPAASRSPRATRTRVAAGLSGSAVAASPGSRRQRKRRSRTMPATAIPRSGACTQGLSTARAPD